MSARCRSNFVSHEVLFSVRTIPIPCIGKPALISYSTFQRAQRKCIAYQCKSLLNLFIRNTRCPRAWQKEIANHKDSKTPGFRKAIARAFWKDFIITTPFVLTEDIAYLIQPILFGYIMGYFQDPPLISTAQLSIASMCLVLSHFVAAFVGPQIVDRMVKLGLRWETSSCCLIYKKLLRLSAASRSNVKTGHVMDLISTDAAKLDLVVWGLHVPWRAVLHIGVVSVVVYRSVGVSTFAALALFCVVLPIQGLFARKVAKHRKLQLGEMDKRMNIISEVVSAMRLVKMYCWEQSFSEQVKEVRKKEMKHIWHGRVWWSLLMELVLCNTRLTLAIMVLVYVAQNNALVAATVFPAFSLFQQLSQVLSSAVPITILTWLDVGVSAKRIERFLMLEELYEDTKNTRDFPGVCMKKVSASWSVDCTEAALKQITLTVRPGELLIIHGSFGSGKTTLLKAILKELPISHGSIQCSRSVAYVPQTPWVFSATLRQNVLFGRPFDMPKYERIMHAVALEADLETLPHGDQTLVGEKGVTLSGGQRARLSLARALYADADLYLLDDPLSAVDTKVGNHIMQKAIKQYLRDKTVVLITHQLQYLIEADQIALINQGSIEKLGSYSDFKPSELCEIDGKDEDKTTSNGDTDQDLALRSKNIYEKELDEKAEEWREYGKVSWRVFGDYLRACGTIVLVLFVLLLFLLAEACICLISWWLAFWSETEESYLNISNNQTVLMGTQSATTHLAYIYVCLLLLSLLLGLFRTLLFNLLTVKSSKNLHAQIFSRIMHAPISFFDTTPKGRIINRFSGDMGSVDNEVPESMFHVIMLMLSISGSMVLLVLVSWPLAFAVLPCAMLLYTIRAIYICTARQISRLHKSASSHVLSHLSNTTDGVECIRAFGLQERCLGDFGLHQDAVSGTYCSWVANFLWFQFSCNATGALLNTFVLIICLLFSAELSPATVGLIFCTSLPLLSLFQEALRHTVELEIAMTSTERVLEYKTVGQERSLHTDNTMKAKLDNWPRTGSLWFHDVSFGYADKHLALKNLSFTIAANDKVGIVGRTGAGKSSIIQSLLRLREPASGSIQIDGVDTSFLGLHDVRGAVTVIPQDAILFSGTVRSNLDPFSKSSDDDIWRSLEQVQLHGKVQSLDCGLESRVEDGGANWSGGERQLLCLARALLNRTRLLVLDEATANVDKSTDELIQRTLRSEFANATVLVIAHRLNTVMDCDKIMVLEAGQLVEYGEPFELLSNGARLSSIVEHTGKEEAARLFTIAKEAHLKRANKCQSKR